MKKANVSIITVKWILNAICYHTFRIAASELGDAVSCLWFVVHVSLFGWTVATVVVLRVAEQGVLAMKIPSSSVHPIVHQAMLLTDEQ